MVWGAGSLLLRLAGRVSTLLGFILWPVRARLEGFFRAHDSRFVRRLVAAATVFALLGPGRPLLEILQPLSPTVRQAAVGEMLQAPHTVDEPSPSAAAALAARTTSHRAIPASAPVQVAPPGKRTALVVGINKAKGGKPLPGSITDAKNVRSALLSYGFPSENITMLLDEQASRSAILHHLDALARRTPADGVAVFVVASHTRRRGASNELLTADGLRISSWEFARKLGQVRSKMWIALPTCYAGGYDVPGITGPGRVVTFASPSSQPTYQIGEAGSYLIINMVRRGMLDERAVSVEDAFRFAKKTLEETHPNRVPVISDGVRGELVLGHMKPLGGAARSGNSDEYPRYGSPPTSTSGTPESSSYGQAPSESPEPTAKPRKKGVGVCGRFQYNCRSDD